MHQSIKQLFDKNLKRISVELFIAQNATTTKHSNNEKNTHTGKLNDSLDCEHVQMQIGDVRLLYSFIEWDEQRDTLHKQTNYKTHL